MGLLLFFVAFGFSGLVGGNDVYKGKEAWGYVNVRPDAYMFWWLYYKDVAEGYANYPLVIWLQGGPGASSTGFGNFKEIGPFDVKLKPRNTTWVSQANLLFLDNPVGTGFSYVTNTSALAKNNTQIAEDLVVTLTSLLENIPEFQNTPMYVFGESYGGKMVADFSIYLYKAIKAGKVKCNFKGVALGDSWISPYDSVASWGQYLYATSLISRSDLDKINAEVSLIDKSLKNRRFVEATLLFNDLSEMIDNMTCHVDFYNILNRDSSSISNQTTNMLTVDHKLHTAFSLLVEQLHTDPLSDLMNGAIKEKLHVIPKNVTWGGQSAAVFDALKGDFMKPVVDSVATLLNETALKVVVYNAQLDLIVDTMGTMNWVENMNWPGRKGFLKASQTPMLLDDGSNGGFVQSFKNFYFYKILRAGHMVPSDNGDAALKMLEAIIGSPKK